VYYTFGKGQEILLDKTIAKNSLVEIEPWGFRIIEEQ
jgi:hypothetical protein